MAHSTTARPQVRTIGRTLENIEAVLLGIHDLLVELLAQEDEMAAEQSAEARALDDAIAGLQAELADVGSVDAEIVADLEGIQTALGKVGPTSPDQVNAVTAVTSSLASLTAKLKAAGQSAAAVEAGAGAGGEAAKAGGEATSTTTAASGEQAAQEAAAAAPNGQGSSSDTPTTNAPAAGSSEAAAQVPQPAGQAVYTYDASVEGAAEDPRFALVDGFRTPGDATPPLAPLYHFSEDTTDGVANGAAVSSYVPFTGTPEVVPAQ